MAIVGEGELRKVALAMALGEEHASGSVIERAGHYLAFLKGGAPAPVPQPSPGRIVLYTLLEADATRIVRQRHDRTSGVGNVPRAGDVVPLLIVRVWDDETVNGQAILDGDDSLWLTSVPRGEGQGSWAWPARV